MLYSIALFFHVTGALLFFAALAIEWSTIFNFRKALSAENVKLNIINYSKLKVIGIIGVLLILIPGFYMMFEIWRGAKWILISLIGLVLIAIIGSTVTSRKMKKIKNKITSEALTLDELNIVLNDNLLFFSIKLRTAVFLGVIFLMTVKPDLTGSLITILLSIIIGIIPVKLRSSKM